MATIFQNARWRLLPFGFWCQTRVPQWCLNIPTNYIEFWSNGPGSKWKIIMVNITILNFVLYQKHRFCTDVWKITIPIFEDWQIRWETTVFSQILDGSNCHLWLCTYIIPCQECVICWLTSLQFNQLVTLIFNFDTVLTDILLFLVTHFHVRKVFYIKVSTNPPIVVKLSRMVNGSWNMMA